MWEGQGSGCSDGKRGGRPGMQRNCPAHALSVLRRSHVRCAAPPPFPGHDPPQACSPALSGVDAPEVTPIVMGPSGSQFSVSTSSPCASLWVTWTPAQGQGAARRG